MRRILGLRLGIGGCAVVLLAAVGRAVFSPDEPPARRPGDERLAALLPGTEVARLAPSPDWPLPQADRAGLGFDPCLEPSPQARTEPFGGVRRADVVEPAAAERVRDPPGERARARDLAAQVIRSLNRAFERAAVHEPTCHENALCVVAAYDAGRRAAVPGLEALARLAASSRDPQVYASAIYACVLADATVLSQACAALKPEQWALLDPDNALPWLYVASVSSIHGDAAALADALVHVSGSRRIAASQVPLLDALKSLPPSSEPVRAVMSERQFGAYGMYMLPDYASAATFCDVDAVSEPSRRQICSGLATLLIEAGTTLRDLLVGMAIGGAVGWPEQRLAALRVDAARLLAARANRSGPACR